MQVSRSGEVTSTPGGGEMSYQPTKGCGCYFEALANGTPTTLGTPTSSYCQACSDADAGADAGGCPAAYPKCNYGFCEVQ